MFCQGLLGSLSLTNAYYFPQGIASTQTYVPQLYALNSSFLQNCFKPEQQPIVKKIKSIHEELQEEIDKWLA